MFADKNAHGIIKHPHIIQASFPGAFTFKVNNAALCEIKIPVSFFLYPVTEIHIFPIHKKCFIKTTYLIQYLFFNHDKSTGKNIYFMILIFVKISKMVFRKYPGVRK